MNKLLRAVFCLLLAASMFASCMTVAYAQGEYDHAQTLLGDTDQASGRLAEFAAGCENIDDPGMSTDYYFLSADIDVTLNPDRSADFVETWRVFFNEESHGIIRHIPSAASTETYEVRDISVDNAPFEIDTYEETIRIGSADTYVSGEQEYIIRYTLAFYDDFYSGYDRMYIDLLGPESDTILCNFTSRVKMPEGVEPEDYVIYSDSGNIKSLYDGGILYLYNTRRIAEYHAVTLDLKLPDGGFVSPSDVMPDVTVGSMTQDYLIAPDSGCTISEHYDITVGNDDAHFIRPLDDYFFRRETECSFSNITYSIGNKQYDASVIDGCIYIDLSQFKKGDNVSLDINYNAEFCVMEGSSPERLIFTCVGYDRGSAAAFKSAEIRVTPPDPASQVRVFCGSFEDYDSYQKEVSDPSYSFDVTKKGDSFVASCKNSIPVGEIVTLQIDSPPGAIQRGARLADKAMPIIMFGILLVALMMIIAKNEHQFTPTIEFYPPDRLNPSEVGYIIDGSVDDRDVTALIYYWASQGHLSIEMKSNNNYILHRLTDLEDTHKDYEKIMFANLWKRGNDVSGSMLVNNFYQTITTTKSMVKKQFAKDRSLEKANAKRLSGIMFLLTIVVFVIAAYKMISSWSFSSGGEYFSILVLALAMIIAFRQSKALFMLRYKKKDRGGKIFMIIIASCVGILAFILAAGGAISRISAAATAALCMAISIVLPWMRARTDYGNDIIARCVGFKQFLTTAEKSRLEMLLEENPSYYYDILPYALVLGVSAIWADKFSGLSMQPPAWFYGPNVTSLTMHRMLNSGMNTMTRQMTSMPQPSGGGFGGSTFGGGGGSFGGGFGGGSFGGGFSGGGGGGGGIGRW